MELKTESKPLTKMELSSAADHQLWCEVDAFLAERSGNVSQFRYDELKRMLEGTDCPLIPHLEKTGQVLSGLHQDYGKITKDGREVYVARVKWS